MTALRLIPGDKWRPLVKRSKRNCWIWSWIRLNFITSPAIQCNVEHVLHTLVFKIQICPIWAHNIHNYVCCSLWRKVVSRNCWSCLRWRSTVKIFENQSLIRIYLSGLKTCRQNICCLNLCVVCVIATVNVLVIGDFLFLLLLTTSERNKLNLQNDVCNIKL